MERILVAMSGGVDSSVAAKLLLDAGYSCVGATMDLLGPHTPDLGKPEQGAAADAAAVAACLGIPFHCFQMQEAFRCNVIDKFVSSYEAGFTPNPCIDCNRHLKFGLLLEKAIEMGCTGIATGHYARVRQDPATGRYCLYKALDAGKDQSYVLYHLSQAQLSRLYLPLGELTKGAVREIAQANGFLNADKKDSQDICFIPDGDYVAFMKRYTGKNYPSGTFLNTDGAPVGIHSGAVCYTLGQRKGLGIALGAPVYVCGKDMAANTVTVGPEAALYHTTLIAEDCNFFPFETPAEPLCVLAKTRYRQTEQPAMLYPPENGRVRVVFDAPQRAMTPGQAVVFYRDDLVIGGGTISEVL